MDHEIFIVMHRRNAIKNNDLSVNCSEDHVFVK